jgi:hypothetical protein
MRQRDVDPGLPEGIIKKEAESQEKRSESTDRIKRLLAVVKELFHRMTRTFFSLPACSFFLDTHSLTLTIVLIQVY